MTPVSVIATKDYDSQTLEAAVARHFDQLGLDSLIRPGMRVVLKPNLLTNAKPEQGVTTHPALMGAIIRRLQALGVENITIADSPGGPYTPQWLKTVYAASGMSKVANDHKVELNTATGFTHLAVPQSDLCSGFNIINPIAEADVVINVCKLKTHAMTGLSAGVKNLFGCIPGLQKPELHLRFPDEGDFGRMLVDLCQTVRPAVTFVDAVVAMEGDGPSAGTLRQVGLTFASQDIYGQDLRLCQLIGLNPMNIPMMRAAINRGLCPQDPNQIMLVGDVGAFVPIPDYRKPKSKSLDFTGHIPAFLRRPVGALAKRLAPHPIIIKKKCIGCGRCAESCPAHVIAIVKGKAEIDYSGCIRCFCCHEMCPVKAVDIKRLGLFG